MLNGVSDRLLSDSTVGGMNDITEGVRIPPEDEIAQAVATLNDGERIIYEAVFSAVNSSSTVATDRLFFVDGPGGSGKTHLYTIIAQKLISAGDPETTHRETAASSGEWRFSS